MDPVAKISGENCKDQPAKATLNGGFSKGIPWKITAIQDFGVLWQFAKFFSTTSLLLRGGVDGKDIDSFQTSIDHMNPSSNM